MPNPVLYHNPRCSKSRQALALLNDHDVSYSVIEYLKTPLTHEEISTVFQALVASNAATTALDMIRTKEPEYRLAGLTSNTSDEDVLDALTAQHGIAETLNTPFDVKRLWDVCQIPDFRNMTIDSHARLVGDIYQNLISNNGKLPDDFLRGRISRLDHTEGGVDILSVRLAQIRTWTY